MSEPTQKTPSETRSETHTGEQQQADTALAETSGKKPPWETPAMEDVSEQVMAQPYIRFT